jgi:hypothetical protein
MIPSSRVVLSYQRSAIGGKRRDRRILSPVANPKAKKTFTTEAQRGRRGLRLATQCRMTTDYTDGTDQGVGSFAASVSSVVKESASHFFAPRQESRRLQCREKHEEVAF